MAPLLRECTIVHGNKQRVKEKFQRGLHLVPHHRFPARCTKCILVRSFRSFFKTAEGRCYKARYPVGGMSSSNSMNKAYIVLKKGFVPGSKEVLLHRLLCYMYHGPPPAANLVASHRCSHKLCIAAWHMLWETRSQDKLRQSAYKSRTHELA